MAGKSKSIEAGNAFVRLFTKDGELRSGLKNASTLLTNFGAKTAKIGGLVMAMGTSVATPILGAAWEYMKAGDDLAKAAARVGVDAESLSSLKHAAEQSGTSVETLEGSLTKMNKAVVAAMGGSKQAAAALAAAGVTAQQLKGLNPEEQFKVIAEGLSRIPDPASRAAAAMGIFGKSGTKLLPMLAGGAAGIQTLQDEARQLGLTMSNEDAAQAEVLGDSIANVQKVMLALSRQIGAAVAPMLIRVAQAAAVVVSGFVKWMGKNRELVATVFKVAAVVVGVGAAITAVGLAGMALGAVLSGIGTVIGIVGAAFSVVLSVLGAILSPIGLFVAALAGVVYYSGAGGAALDWLMERFGSLAGDATAAFGAIGKALSSGNLGLAAQIAWSFIKVQFRAGVDACVDLFYDLADSVSDVWHGIQNTMAVAAVDAFSAVDAGVVSTTDFFADAWTETVNWVAKQFESIAVAAEKAWLWVQSFWDDSIDLDVEFKRLDEGLAGFDAAADENAGTEISERERERQAKLAAIERDRQETQSELERMQEDERRKREAGRAGRNRGDSEELKNAQREFADALAEAEKLTPSGKAGTGESLADRLKGLPDFSGAVATGESKMSSGGTFMAAGVGGLTNNMESRIAAATEESAGYLWQLLQKEDDKELG